MNCDQFEFIAGNIIKEEIRRKHTHQLVKEAIENNVKTFSYYNYREILKPFLSQREIRKGEDELIAISIILYHLNEDFLVILDDAAARGFLEKNFPEPSRKVRGTVGFLKLCCCNYKILSKEKTILILNKIKNSKFRATEEVVERVIGDVGRCCDR
ncbi:MAG: hypothetical protein QXW47_10015 [Candidatus Jordarchaeales archaeon]